MTARTMRKVDHAIQAGKRRNARNILIGNSGRKRPVDRHRCRNVYKTEIELEERKYKNMEWIQLAHNVIEFREGIM
jgi:hypothetical protein